MIWNGIGLLRLIYRRNKERKEGEKFFDTKTAIFFSLSLIANVFSVATFLNTIGPLMRELLSALSSNCHYYYIYNLSKCQDILPHQRFGLLI